MKAYTEIRPFTISIPNQQLDELSAKLELTRLPDELDLPPGQEWEWGMPLAVLKPIVEYWRTKYDWRTVEERLNRTIPQFTTCVESLNHGAQEVHFVYKRSDNPNAVPLLFVHGWPGNFLEVSKMIDELTNPKDPKNPSFHVVAPSLPGFVFSQRASTPGMDARGSAYLFDKLMAKLGYKHYMAQGGDWGAVVVRALEVFHHDTCLASHTNVNFSAAPSPLWNPLMTLKTILGFAGLPGGYSKAEVDGLKQTRLFWEEGGGYLRIQGTRPQTLAFALTDSPVGLLAWIGEKLYVWTDNYQWTPEEVITWTMLYWVKGPAGGLRFYKENPNIRAPSAPESLSVYNAMRKTWSPTLYGFSYFPKEISRTPLEWCGLNHKLVFTNSHKRGGHFAAWEVPELLSADIQDFTKIVVEKEPRLLGSS